MLALPISFTSLGVDSKFRTIDIDTSDQVHQIGGRFDEALSTSLSIHGAHEEALRRIEHYSITSMHSSAHSIRSMDSIRTELSRLEAMITSPNVPQPSETETGKSPSRPGSSCSDRRCSAVPASRNRDSPLSVSGPLPEPSGESFTAEGSGIKLAPRQDVLNENPKSLDRSNQSQRPRSMAIEHRIHPDYHISSAEYRSFMDDSEDINSRPMEFPSDKGNRSSFLYAEFSKNSQPRQRESPEIDNDRSAIHGLLRQSLASVYPPEVVDYVSLQQVATLCEDHIKLLNKRPSVQTSATGKTKEMRSVDDDIPTSAQPSMVSLRKQLLELRNAIKAAREQCIQAGFSLSELDKLLSPPGSGSYASAIQPPPMQEPDGGDDSSSVYSEDFHSSKE